jgi:hypothetical protein
MGEGANGRKGGWEKGRMGEGADGRKGEINVHYKNYITPFQGFRYNRNPVPRALPWAEIFSPFRGNMFH